jgi:putative ABC transport system ATP-binding protein
MDITADDVTVVIDGQLVVAPARLTCRGGTVTALVGPSGSGKTTLLHCLGLLQVPTRGRVLVDGIDTSGWGTGRRRRFWRDRAAFVLQDAGVMDEESVGFNVTMRATILGNRTRGDRSLLGAALRATGLEGRESEPAAHLSGGEKQRLAVARAIYTRAQVVYVDEPTASLDDVNRHAVIDLLTGLARGGCTVIVATHDPAVMAAADSRYELDLEPRGAVSHHRDDLAPASPPSAGAAAASGR